MGEVKMERKYALEVMWYITDKCNLQCKHCYSGIGSSIGNEELNFSECEEVINQIKELKENYHITRVGLLGGEPLIRKDILDIIRLLSQVDVDVNLGTNGTLITNEIAVKLKDTGVSFVQVSLEGPNEEVNDKIRGKGNFRKANEGLKHLIGTGIKTGIMMTVSKHNINYIREMIEFSLQIGVKSIAFNRFIPIGRGKSMHNLTLSNYEFKQMLETLIDEKIKNKNIMIHCEDPLFYLNYYAGTLNLNYAKGGCSAGISVIAVLPDGSIYPCRKLPIVLGNIRENKISSILTKEDNFVLNTLRMREQLKGKCGICKKKFICGGCRAMAYALTGDYMGEDPHCVISTEVLK